MAQSYPRVKLFVGQIPSHYKEADIRPIFEQFHNLISVQITYDESHKSKRFLFLFFSFESLFLFQEADLLHTPQKSQPKLQLTNCITNINVQAFDIIPLLQVCVIFL